MDLGLESGLSPLAPDPHAQAIVQACALQVGICDFSELPVLLDQCHPFKLFAVMKMFRVCMSSTVTTIHMWLLYFFSVASATNELNFISFSS